MGRNDINLDRINARLGYKNNPNQHNDYGDDNDKLQDFEDDGGKNTGSSLTAGFLLSMVGMFIAVFSGVFFYLGGQIPVGVFGGEGSSHYVSTVDKQCGEGWRDGLPNDTQLKCYLTKDIKRLCKVDEQKRLVAVLTRYRIDKTIYDAKLVVGTMSTLGKTQTQGLSMGLAAAQMQQDWENPDITNEQKSAQLTNVIGMSNDIMSDANEVIEKRGPEVPPHELANDIRNILAAGIMTLDDFGWIGDQLVNTAAENLVVKTQYCLG